MLAFLSLKRRMRKTALLPMYMVQTVTESRSDIEHMVTIGSGEAYGQLEINCICGLCFYLLDKCMRSK